MGRLGTDAVLTPTSGPEVAQALAAAAAARHRVCVRGAGTKSDWVRAPIVGDLTLSTSRLTRIVNHAHGDLTVEVESGAMLEALNHQLRAQGQWLPLESAFQGATIGGVLATNESGPLRHRYGSPRDLLLGARLATTDGRLVRSGGNVVKNVAGYDLARLVTGSFGSLAVIVSATFKLVPWPAAFGTSTFVFSDSAAAAHAAASLAASQLDPAAIEVVTEITSRAFSPEVRLVVRFTSTHGVVATQIAEAERLVGRYGPDQSTRWSESEDVAPRWQEHMRHPWQPGRTVIKVSWLPAMLDSLLGVMAEGRRRGLRIGLVGRVGLGQGWLWIEGDHDAQIGAMEEMRTRRDVFRAMTVVRVDATLRARLRPPEVDAGVSRVLFALKQAFDPGGVLSGGAHG